MSLHIQLLLKVAASRMDKEMQAGNIKPSDVVPGTPLRALQDDAGSFDRTVMRARMRTPEQPPADKLKRLRQMRARLAEQQLKNPAATLGLPPSQARRLSTVTNKDDLMYGLVPGAASGIVPDDYTKRRSRRKIFIKMPERGIDPTGMYRQSPTPARDAFRLPVVQHELGEAEHFLGPAKNAVPHATHLGVRPHIREALNSVGDPYSQLEMAKLRMGAEDTMVGRIMKSIGHTPDRPIPLGGKQEKTLQRLLRGVLRPDAPFRFRY